MANEKLPQLPILTAITDADLFYVVDVSDTTDDPTGSSKQVTREEILTNVSYVDFNTTATTTHAEGRIHWNNTLKTLEVDTDNANVHVTVGQELISRVNNQTGSVLSKGRAVYINGQQGNRPTVAYGSYTADTSSAGIIGLVADDINDNNNGYIISYGLIEGIDTSAYSAGTPLYLYTGGTITSTKPIAPFHDVRIGKVINSNSTVGSIFVNVQNGYELDELHDVRITSPTTNDMLVYSSYNGTPVWVNTKTLSGLTYVGATTISATTYQNLPVDPNYYTTAFTYSNNVFTIKQTGQADLTATINSVTGWTVNGDLTVTGNTSLQGVTATTVSATTISATTFYGSGTNLTGVLKGAGITNYLPKWTGTTGQGNSQIQDDGTSVGINVSPNVNYRTSIYTSSSAQTVTLYVQNQSNNGGSVGTAVYGYGLSTGVLGLANSNSTPIGVIGIASDGSTVIGVQGFAGKSEFGSATTTIGGYFNSTFDYGGGSVGSYSVQLVDGTEGVGKILKSMTADGKANWVDPTTIQTAFNYGLANAIMTGNFLT